LRRARIAIAAVHELGKSRPIGRHRLQQGLEIGNPNDRHTAAEDFRRERGTDERGKAAVRPPEDRYLIALSDALTDCPLNHVDKVIMHLSSVLLLARGDEGFAETGRTAVVDREYGISTVSEPLVIGAVAVAVPGPGSPMDNQHHW